MSVFESTCLASGWGSVGSWQIPVTHSSWRLDLINSGWLDNTVALDDKGFVLTGTAGTFDGVRFATTVPGIYAVGDVRSGSVKRVASTVGQESAVVADIHRYFAEFCEGS